MGRWRRNNKNRQSRNDNKNGFNDRDCKTLLAFLHAYRRGAIRFHRNEDPFEFETVARKVGNIELPILSELALMAPYLALPAAFRSKQRKVIHELCVEANLQHATLEREDDRQLVISIYSDGFNSIEEQLASHQMSFPFHQYRPWFCRKERVLHKEDSVCIESQEMAARKKIETLIDQPGDSIRDIVDALPIREDVGSLADVPLPSDVDWIMVDSEAAMTECIAELNTNWPSAIAFDLEACNQSKFSQLTCLIQLAVKATETKPAKHYVIDTLAQGVWDSVHGLAPLFGDPSIVKIGHSISGLDVQSLHRDFGIFVVNAFDTYEAAKVLELKRCGLAAVCQYYGMNDCESYSELKTLYQTCDWTRRPLTQEMIRYGRYDVNFLIPLREIMMRDLTREAWSAISGDSQLVANALQETLMQFSMEDNDEDWFNYPGPLERMGNTMSTEDMDGETKDAVKHEDFVRPSQLDAATLRMQPNLMRVVSISQDRCLKLWRKRVEPPMQNPYLAALIQRSQRGEVEWTKARIRLYSSLAEWREGVAQELECLAPFVISLNFLLHLAHRRPIDEMGLLSISRSYPCILKEPLFREQVFDIIRDSFEEEGAQPKITEVFLYSKRTAKLRLPTSITRSGTEDNSSISALGWKLASIFVGATVLLSLAVSRSRRK